MTFLRRFAASQDVVSFCEIEQLFAKRATHRAREMRQHLFSLADDRGLRLTLKMFLDG
jgi:hypothetical protein